MLNRDRKRKENNRLKDWIRENRQKAREADITVQ
jgi:hypothetical protein